MITIDLKTSPSVDDINKSIQQEEGIPLESEDGERYSFLPNGGTTRDGGYFGVCWSRFGTILANKKSGVLYLEETPNVGPLLILFS